MEELTDYQKELLEAIEEMNKTDYYNIEEYDPIILPSSDIEFYSSLLDRLYIHSKGLNIDIIDPLVRNHNTGVPGWMVAVYEDRLDILFTIDKKFYLNIRDHFVEILN